MENVTKENDDQVSSGNPETEEAEPKEVTVEEIANQLEIGNLSPDLVDTETKRKCVMFYRIKKRYSNHEIARILDMSIRNVERYRKKIRDENVMNLSVHWQKNIIGEFLFKSKKQIQRLEQLQEKEDLSPAEMIRISRSLHQIHTTCLTFLEKNGYLTKNRTINDLYEAITEKENSLKNEENEERELFAYLDRIRKEMKDLQLGAEGTPGSGEERFNLFKKRQIQEVQCIKRLEEISKSIDVLYEENAREANKYVRSE